MSASPLVPRVFCEADLALLSYRTTLNQRDQIQDEEEKSSLLKGCHKRSAERTLRVLEKNGGIFIKLGQHLVHPTISSRGCPKPGR